MSEQVKLPEGVKVWWLSCPEHWDVRPVNEAAVEATKLHGWWPTDCDVVALADLPVVLAQRDKEWREALLGDEARQAAGRAAYLDRHPDCRWEDETEVVQMSWEGNASAGVQAAIDKAAPNAGGES